jgi:hypothetical protein
MWQALWNVTTSIWQAMDLFEASRIERTPWKDLKDIRDFVDIVFKSIAAIATIVGGAWAYYHFIKGRVFKPRLTLSTSARRLQTQGTEYVLSTIELSNVGLSRIEIASADIRVCSISGTAVDLPQLIWLKTVNVLLAHSSVEPGEILKEQNILALASDQNLPILLDFRVVAKGISFTATTIAEPSDQDDPKCLVSNHSG